MFLNIKCPFVVGVHIILIILMSSSSGRIYIGGLNPRAHREDIERFIKGVGRARDIIMKNGFCFVEFDDRRDASDAVHDLHGREFMGNRVSVEAAHGTPHGRDKMYSGSGSGSGGGYGRSSGGSGYGGSSRYGGSSGYGGRYGSDRGGDRRYRAAPPVRSSHRVVVENLANGVSWQDLKNFVRQSADVVYADVFSSRNEGIVEFSSSRDMKRALDQLDGADFHGRRLKLVEDRRTRSSSSPSPPRGGGGSGRRRRSDSRNGDDARSGAGDDGSRSRSRSRGASGKKARRRSPSSSRSKSASSRSSRSSVDRRSPAAKNSSKSKDKSKERDVSSDKKNGISTKENENSSHDD